MRRLLPIATACCLLLIAVLVANAGNSPAATGVPNWSFEIPDPTEPSQAAYWLRDGFPGEHSVSLDSSVSYFGALSLRLRNVNAKPSVTSVIFPLSGPSNTAYQLRVFSIGDSGGETLNELVYYADSKGNQLSVSPITPFKVTTTWQPYSFTSIPPASARKAVVWFEEGDRTSQTRTIWIDGVSLQPQH
jgi:hypothetical protein